MRKLILITLLLLITVPTLAQESDFTYTVIDFEAIGAMLLNSVGGAALAAFGAAPITVVIVNAIKFIPALQRFTAPQLTLAVAAILYLIAILAEVSGKTIALNSVLDWLTTAIPPLTSFLVTLFGAPALYNAAKKRHISVLGASRNNLHWD